MNPGEMLATLTALVGIYLLLSLIGTAFSDLLVSKLGLRGETLQRAVSSLLGAKGSEALYDRPAVLSLSEEREHGPLERWLARQFFGPEIAPRYLEPARGIPRNLVSAALWAQLPKDAVSGMAVSDKKLNPRRRPSEIPPATFADAALEVLLGDGWRGIAKDPPQLRERLKQQIAAQDLDADLAGQVDGWIAASNDCGNELPARLAARFTEVNDRAQGWFKRRIARSLLIIGLLIALLTNADTLQLFARLSQDTQARAQALQLAEKVVADSELSCGSVDPASDAGSARACLARLGDPGCRALDPARDAAGFKTCIATTPGLKIVRDLPRLASCDTGSGGTMQDSIRCYAGELSPMLSWSHDPAATWPSCHCGQGAAGCVGFWRWLRLWLVKVLGFALTAGAISLGAPFWFDLLRKLVGIRKALAGGGGDAATTDAARDSSAAPATGDRAAAVPGAGQPASAPGTGGSRDVRYATNLTGFAWQASGFDLMNAYWLGYLSKLAYLDGPDIERRCEALGLQAKFFTGNAMLGNEHLQKLFGSFDASGFVAWTNEACFVVFRGSRAKPTDWITDFSAELIDRPGGKVHAGFQTALDAVWGDAKSPGPLAQILDQTVDGGGRRLWIAGHSLGGALAVLAARTIGDWAQTRNLANRNQAAGQSAAQAALAGHRAWGDLAGLYTYGQPRAADAAWTRLAEQACGARWQRFVNAGDVVTRVPLRAMGFEHGGRVHYYDEQGRLHDDPAAWFRWLDTTVLNDASVKDALKANGTDHFMDRYLARIRGSAQEAGFTPPEPPPG